MANSPETTRRAMGLAMGLLAFGAMPGWAQSFREKVAPLVKSGGFGRFELYDLSNDPGQKRDIAARFPDVVSRLKEKLLALHASVIADAPDWLTPLHRGG